MIRLGKEDSGGIEEAKRRLKGEEDHPPQRVQPTIDLQSGVDPQVPIRRFTVVPDELLVVKTINTVTHRGCRGARPARREEGEYREYLTDEQRGRSGWIGSRMPSYLWF
jgi:hypothetical protein